MTFHDDEPLSSELQALLKAERARPELPSEVSSRIAGKLAASLPFADMAQATNATHATNAAHAGSQAASSTLPPAAVSSAASGSGLAALFAGARMLPIVLAFVGGGAMGAGVTAAWMSSRSADEARAAEARVAQRQSASVPDATEAVAQAKKPSVVDSPVAPVVPTAPAEVAADQAAAAPPDTVRAPKSSASSIAANGGGERAETAHAEDHDLGAEQRLLEQARAALARGLAEDAWAALERHAQRFPKGRLREERESLRVPVLVVLGRYAEARKTATRFSARYPSSLFSPVVERALRSIP